MNATVLTGTILKQAGYNGGWNPYGADNQYAGYGVTSFFTTIISFQTPEFLGLSSAVSISVNAKNKGDVLSPTLRWALATSDDNRNVYVETNGEITREDDPSQIVSGICTFQGIASSTANNVIHVETTQLEPATTYYLYLWGYEANNWLTVYSTKNHSVSIHYYGGVVYIDEAGVFQPYLAYIDNGSSWDLHIPYIDNGSAWDLCS